MKNKELFDKTIGILVKAFHNDTLRHSDCSACAVGNLVAANMGLKTHPSDSKFILPDGGVRDPEWYDGFYGKNTIAESITGLALVECQSTGYSIEELVKIEAAFELPRRSHQNVDSDGYLGLMNVCDTLMTIHEATTTEIETAKSLFTQPCY